MASFYNNLLSGSATNEEIIDEICKTGKQLDFLLASNLGSQNIREIGDFLVGSSSIVSRSGNVGLSSLVTGANDVRIWAGGSTPETAPFRVYENGDINISGGTISWSDIDAPNYSDILGTKPPTNADNTSSILVGNGFTVIGSTYIYTGTLNANQINVGTLTGFTIQTAATGQRIVQDINGLRSYDSGGIKRLAIAQSGSRQAGMTGFEVFDPNGNYGGVIFGYTSGNARMWVMGENGLTLSSWFGETVIRDNVNFTAANISGLAISDITSLQGTLDGKASTSALAAKSDTSYVNANFGYNLAFDPITRNLKMFASNGALLATVNIP